MLNITIEFNSYEVFKKVYASFDTPCHMEWALGSAAEHFGFVLLILDKIVVIVVLFFS